MACSTSWARTLGSADSCRARSIVSTFIVNTTKKEIPTAPTAIDTSMRNAAIVRETTQLIANPDAAGVNRDRLTQLIAARTGLSPQDAAARLQDVEKRGREAIDQARQTAREAADKAARAGTQGELTKATVFGRWEQLVGPEIAGRCEPVSLVDGELVLQAESTAWATQLRMLSAQLMAKINAEVGAGTISRIRARGPSAPSWKFGPRHVSGRGPRDTYG